MGRPKTVSDAEILRKARQCFLEQGPSVSTEKIAATLGISQPALFKRFKSKQKLMIAALGPANTAPWVRELENGPNDRPFSEQLRYIAYQIVDFFKDISPCLSILRSSGINPQELLTRHKVPPPILAVRALCKWLEQCHKKGLIVKTDFNATSMAILGSLHMPVFLKFVIQHKHGSLIDKKYVEAIIQLYANSLEAKERKIM